VEIREEAINANKKIQEINMEVNVFAAITAIVLHDNPIPRLDAFPFYVASKRKSK
jgi:hypothetical protein